LRRTGIVRDNLFLEHKTGIHHIEVAQRLATVYSMLDESGLMEKLIHIPSRYASLEEVEMVHTPSYIEKIMDTAGEPLMYLDPDTVTSEKSCQAAFLAAGGVIESVKLVLHGELDNACALIRPPGHHAERDRQMGFCIFNNVALAAEYALRYFGLTRILIVDWDVHHPNGTQHIFETTKQVLVFSSHRYPFFPGTGDVVENGLGEGKGYTINVPLTPQRTDCDYAEVYKQLLVPIALEFAPQLVLLSFGFDIHYDDPIGGMQATEYGVAALTHTVVDLADQTCGGKIVAVLEGGYDLGAVRKSTKAMIQTMLGEVSEQQQPNAGQKRSNNSAVSDIIQKVKEVNKPYWKSYDDTGK
jgi:acetoin utilization deacetylase AcuC-like enzyme